MAKYIKSAYQEFQQKDTVRDRGVHIPVPAIVDGDTVPYLTGAELRTFNKKRSCLLIWGEGGAGKTSGLSH